LHAFIGKLNLFFFCVINEIFFFNEFVSNLNSFFLGGIYGFELFHTLDSSQKVIFSFEIGGESFGEEIFSNGN